MINNLPGKIRSSGKSPGSHDFEVAIGRIGSQLSRCVMQLLAALPDGTKRPAGLSRVLGINKDLSSKLLIASGKRDPLAAAYYMPGPEALRKVLSAAMERDVDQAILDELNDAVQNFESLVRDEVGGRTSLDAMISAWLPEARTRFEMANRQGAYKAMSNIKGLTTDVTLHAVLVHPSEQSRPHDLVTLLGCVGLRRIRPGVPIRISTGMGSPGSETQQPLTLDGKPMDAFSADSLLADFCSQPLPPIEFHKQGAFVKYVVASDRLGLGSSADLFFAEYASGFLDQYNPSPGLCASHSADIEIPTRELLFDVFLHRDVWPGVEPELNTYDTALYGEVNVNDRSRDIDRLDLLESIQPLGTGISACRVASIPQYVNMLRFVCKRRGWDPDAFRGFRCHTHYPVYGSQLIMAFDRRSPTTTRTNPPV